MSTFLHFWINKCQPSLLGGTRYLSLAQEIESKRPLLPSDMPMSDIVKEILDTYKAAGPEAQNSWGGLKPFFGDVRAVHFFSFCEDSPIFSFSKKRG